MAPFLFGSHMADLSTQPYNPNFLNPNNFRFMLKRAPNIMFFVQEINLPGMEGEMAEQGSPFVRIMLPGTKVNFEDLRVTFKVDENFENYFEIYHWMEGLYFPDGGEQHKALTTKGHMTGEGLYSDCTLTVLSSSKNPNIDVTFRDAYPIALSELSFNAAVDNIDYISCTVTFRYTRFTVRKI